MFLGVTLVRCGMITADDFVAAIERQMDRRPRLGRLALDKGKLTMRQVFAVLEEQTISNKPFGETATALGFVTKRQITYLLRQQRELTPSFSECLVEIGAIDAETLERQRSNLRNETKQCHRGSAKGHEAAATGPTDHAESIAS